LSIGGNRVKSVSGFPYSDSKTPRRRPADVVPEHAVQMQRFVISPVSA